MWKLRGLALAMVVVMVGSVFGQGTWVKPRISKSGKYVKGYHRRSPAPKPKAPKQSGLFKTKKPKVSRPKKGGLFGSIPSKKSSSKSGLFAPKKSSSPKSSSGLFGPKKTPKKSAVDSDMSIRFPRDSRFMSGDRVVSVKDSSGKTYSINTKEKYREFMASHLGGKGYTVKIRRDGKYLTRKVDNLNSLGL